MLGLGVGDGMGLMGRGGVEFFLDIFDDVWKLEWIDIPGMC